MFKSHFSKKKSLAWKLLDIVSLLHNSIINVSLSGRIYSYLSDGDPLMSCYTQRLKHLVFYISKFIDDKLWNSKDFTSPAQSCQR